MGGAQLTAYHGNGKSGEPPSQSGPGPGTPKIAAIFAEMPAILWQSVPLSCGSLQAP